MAQIIRDVRLLLSLAMMGMAGLLTLITLMSHDWLTEGSDRRRVVVIGSLALALLVASSSISIAKLERATAILETESSTSSS